MLKKINAVIFLIFLWGTTCVYAQFPYYESFKNSTASDIVFGGAPNPAYLTSGKLDPITGLDPVGDGYLRLTNNTNNQTGFIHNKTSFPSQTGLKIEFEFFTYGGQADGITFFLYDGTYDDIQKPFNIGGFGGSLGYAQYKDTGNGKIYAGVSGGYLGIGIDEYGNFSNPIENRSGGIVGPVSGGLSPNSITLRGKGNGSSTDSENYKYLTSKRTTDPDLDFNLITGGRHTDVAHPDYRKAIVILEPKAIGYYITVKIVTGGTLGKTNTVINRYAYDEPAPALVRYGIASSTGFYHNYHEIRNVRINTFEPLAINDLGYITSRNKEINIPILENDIDGNNVIDPTTVTIRPASSTASITVSSTGKVTYKPQNGFVGQDVFYYTVKDKDGLVSNEARVEVDVQFNGVKPVGTNDIAQTNINVPVTIPVLLNDVNNVDVTVIGNPTSTAGGTTTVNPNGTITYNPKSGFTGSDTFTYTLKNSDDLVSDPITVTITVNAPPVAVNDVKTTGMDVPVDIDLTTNDTDPDGTVNKSSVIITDPPLGTVTVNATTGIITFKPKTGFVGKDIFYYTVKDDKGLISNKAKVEIEIKPQGLPDNVTTTLNTPITINVLSNDPSKTGVTVIPLVLSVKGAILVNADNTVKYTPLTGSLGSDTFTYKIRTVDGLESDPITVTIVINTPPIANNDNRTTLMDEFVEIDVPTNDTDADGTINKASVVVKVQPAHGTVGQPDSQGNVTYTPALGYVGSDSFTYTIKDNNGTESAPATVTITIASVPKIGLSKALTSVKNSTNGTFIVRFTFTVGNYGIEPLEKVSIKDNLATTFAGTEVKVIAINPTGTLKANNNYNGVGDIELLDQSSTLAANTTATVELILNVILISSDGTYQNTSIAEAYSTASDQKTTDASVAGEKPDPFVDGDVTPSGPTFFQLKKGPLYIPEGFSPNGDGINDFFIVSNSQGKTLNLEVYNRWGNKVYKSTAYQNDWGGRCTEGIFVGQDLPVGTYYYIIVIDNNDKRVGYITINR